MLYNISVGLLNKNNSNRRKKATTGFSELNRRTYEASPSAQRDRKKNTVSTLNSSSKIPNNRYHANNQIPSGNVNDYSRGAQQSRYAQARKKQLKKSRRKKILIIIASIIAALLVAAAICIAALANSLNSGMDNIGLVPTSLDKPFYMVLMGVDSSEERRSDGSTDADYRSDSIILARIAADERKVTLMSLHRDIEVDMGQYGTQKLNAAHSLGGPELVIKTVSKLCGVDINHYAEINFDGFKAAVDDIGGIDINVPIEIDDYLAGGYVPAGQQHLDGEQALVMCRARHAFDSYGDGDKYRAANQRAVLTAIAQQALSKDIVTIAKTATDLFKYIKTDLALNDMIGLGQLMKDIDPKTDVYSAMTPTEGVLENGTWYEKLDEAEFSKMMKRMDKGLPPDEFTYIDPLTGTVMSTAGGQGGNWNASVAVRNGTEISGLASEVSGILYGMGFTTDIGNAESSDYTKTLVVYNDDSQYDAAEAIVDVLLCGRSVKNTGEYSFSTDILVIVGTDYRSL